MIWKLFGGGGLAMVGLLGLVQMAAAQAPVIGAGCPCPEPCPEKVCHRVTETKTVTERKYSDTCEDYCRTRCPWFLGLLGCGCDCADGNCGSVHTKKYLVIHFPKHEECVTKCVPGVAEAPCQAPCPPPCYSPAPIMAPPVAPPPAPKVGAMMMPTGPVQAQQWPR